MNKLNDVMAMFDLSLNEKFNLRWGDGFLGADNPYLFTEMGLQNSYGMVYGNALMDMVTGIATVEKIPIRPDGELEFWYVDLDGTIKSKLWEGTLLDTLLYTAKNYFLNEETATVQKDVVLRVLLDDPTIGLPVVPDPVPTLPETLPSDESNLEPVV